MRTAGGCLLTNRSSQVPDDPRWPSELAWSSLNETMSSRLIRTILLASTV